MLIDQLTKALKPIGFFPLEVDECVFTRGTTIVMYYVDNGIFADPNSDDITKAIK